MKEPIELPYEEAGDLPKNVAEILSGKESTRVLTLPITHPHNWIKELYENSNQ